MTATTTQFSIFMIDKPGALARIINAIADAKINLVALTIVDAKEHGVLRLVARSAERLRSVLNKLNVPSHETQVLTVELSNRTGALAIVVAKLAEAKVNIDYAYVTASAAGGKTTGVLKGNELARAQKLLAGKTKDIEKRTTVKGRSVRTGGR
jgi:hypothetical protein